MIAANGVNNALKGQLKNSKGQSERQRTTPFAKKRKIMRKKLIILFLGLLVLMAGCKAKEVPGRRRAPRHCNTCTKWSYVPQKVIDYEA